MNRDTALKDPSVELLVAKATDELIECLNRGEQPEIDEYEKRYPQIASIIRQVFPALQIMRASTSGDDSSKDRPTGDASVTGQLGDYRLVREAGRGGMGVVYEAEQVSLGRKVALKVLPFAAVLDQRQLQRFKNEAQAAAQLHHTNIVPVHSVGCERGVHYYAMQYIEGSTLAEVIHELHLMTAPEAAQQEHPASRASELATDLTLTTGRFARPKGSSTDAKLDETAPAAEGSSAALAAIAPEHSIESPAFFRSVANLGIQAAEALDHAHESGVIHRDIKPSNLLLDLRGNLWITDFGLARLESDPGLTMTGDILGTVRYMSPEQALAKRIPIDHRTDIYSLGVTLYELLTLQPAFTGRDRQELLRQIAFEEPRQPRRVNRAIPTELETIVLKAVNKNPEQRYATAKDLADDLERFLEDKPIKAKRPSLMERAGKWSRRHRTVVAAGVVVLVMAVVGLSVSTVLIWQEQARTQAALHQMEQQREQADANFQKARQAVDQMLTQVAEGLPVPPALADSQQLRDSPLRPLIPKVEEVKQALLEDALEYYQWFLQERSGDPSMRYETGRAYMRVAQITREMQQHDLSAETCRRAIDLLGGLSTELPGVAEYRRDLGRAEWLLGGLHQAGRRNLAAAEHAYDRAIRVYESLAADFPDEPSYRSDLAVVYRDLGYLLDEFGQFEQAEAAYRHAADLNEDLTAEFPNVRVYRDRLASCYLGTCSVLMHAGHFQEAEEAFNEAIDLRTKLIDQWPDKAGQRRLINCYCWFSVAAAETGHFDEAEAVCRTALEAAEDLVAQFPGEPDYRSDLAKSYCRLGDVFRRAERPEVAVRAYRQAENLARELESEFPWDTEYAGRLGAIRAGLSALLRQIGRVQEADELFREQHEALARGSLAAELHLLAKHSPGGVAEAVERARSVAAARTPVEPYSLLVCGEYLLLGGEPHLAVPLIQQSIESGGDELEHWYYKSLGSALLSAGREKEARAAFQETLAGFETWAPTPSEEADPDHWTAAYFLDLVSREQYTQRCKRFDINWARHDSFPWFYVGQRAEIEGRIDDAIAAYEKAVELGETHNPHITANWAAYRLQVLRGERTEDESEN